MLVVSVVQGIHTNWFPCNSVAELCDFKPFESSVVVHVFPDTNPLFLSAILSDIITPVVKSPPT